MRWSKYRGVRYPKIMDAFGPLKYQAWAGRQIRRHGPKVMRWGYQQLKNMLNVEYKRFNYTNSSVSIGGTTNGSKVPCMGIASGSGAQQRNGDSIRVKYIRIRALLKRNASDTSLSTAIRLILIRDSEISTTTADLGNIFTSETLTGYKQDGYNIRQRYHILKDKVFWLNKDENEGKMITWYIPYNRVVRYTGTAASDYGPNNVFLYYFSQESDGTNLPEMDIEIETVYIDN